jgi:predicted metal-binding protein
MNQTETHESRMASLLELATCSGATDARVISTGDILIEDRLADICKETRCESYGRSKSCPPYVAGPSMFREWIKTIDHAIVLKIDVPLEMLLSEREDIMRLLHEIVATVELAAIRLGYANSKAFAGGSCKQFFCPSHADCRVVTGKGDCRNPQRARPSMSGFGVNVPEMMKTAGWTGDEDKSGSHKERSLTGTVSGLILIG